MRRFLPALLVATPLFLAAETLCGQQLPIGGCGAASSCAGPRGFKSLLDFSGQSNSYPFFAVRLTYEGRLRLRVVEPPRPSLDIDAIEAAVALFVARHPLRGTSRDESAVSGDEPRRKNPPEPPKTPADSIS